MTLDQLRTLVDGAAAEDLPDIIGALEGAKARAFARLTTPATVATTNGSASSDRVLSMPEVAERLGLSVYTAREHGRRGELKVVTIGRRVVVRESSVREFLDRRETGRG